MTVKKSCCYYVDFVLPSSSKSVLLLYSVQTELALHYVELNFGCMRTKQPQLIYSYSMDVFNKASDAMLLLTKGQGSTEAAGAAGPSAGNVLCHTGPPLGRGSLLWSASPTSARRRTTASGEAHVTSTGTHVHKLTSIQSRVLQKCKEKVRNL